MQPTERPLMTASLDVESDRPFILRLPRVGALAYVHPTRDEAEQHIAACAELVRWLDATA
ncbi:hypothetical protein [Streptomyces sp. SID3343]|uniref:hypothetical protein n=1 Tax=Streptomyces sp. SID3343 TaxID=2690260 RepID=UPI001369AAA4|nr:hypothetical protein [Streptomyces sp. SID3343]